MAKPMLIFLSLFLASSLLYAAEKKVEKREVQKDGTFLLKEYSEKGVLLRETPLNKEELPHGIATEYENGKRSIEWAFDEGVLNGLSRFYYASYVEERPYRAGKAQGVSKISIDGREVAEMPYKDNRTYGLAKFYGEPKHLPYTAFCRDGAFISGECEGGRKLSAKEAEGRCDNIFKFIFNPPNCER